MNPSKWMALAALLATLMTAAPARAALVDEELRNDSIIADMVHKLGRGVTNIFTGWIELPFHIVEEWRKSDIVSGIFTGGVKGTVWGFVRTFSGFYDVFTFPIPIPFGYKPLYSPEFIVTAHWGASTPLEDQLIHMGPVEPITGPVYPDEFNF